MEKIIAIALVALGTYLTRVTPLCIKIRSNRDVEVFLSYSSSAILSALLVTSLVSFPLNVPELSVRLVALVPVAITYWRWNNLGMSVLAGVLSHFMLNAFL